MTGVPNTFANATSSIPLVQLDQNFATQITVGSTLLGLGNTVSNLAGLNNVTANIVTCQHVQIGAGYSITANAQAANYVIDAVSSIGGRLMYISWDNGDGFALCVISNGGGGIPTLVGSSNALGGDNAFDTVNNFNSNGGFGLGINTFSGAAYIQSKTSGYTGPIKIGIISVL